MKPQATEQVMNDGKCHSIFLGSLFFLRFGRLLGLLFGVLFSFLFGLDGSGMLDLGQEVALEGPLDSP